MTNLPAARRVRASSNPGDPDLGPADLQGTAFLLQVTGRVPEGEDPLRYARAAHRAAALDRAKRCGLRGRPLARGVLRVTGYDSGEGLADRDGGVDFRDPLSGVEVRGVEAADLLAKIREALTLDEAGLLTFRLRGLSLAEIAPLIGLTERATYMRWDALVKRVKARFTSFLRSI